MPGSIRVLHVDDEPDFAALTADYLELQSPAFDVVTETESAAALERILSEDIDCVVSDHDMPGMTGIELLEAVREERPDLPFVLFTGKGSEAVASEAISAGVTDYLQKESGTEQYALLANRIENAVDRHRSQRAVAEQKRRLETLVSNVPGVVYRCRNEPGWPLEEIAGECAALTGYAAEAFESGDVSWGADVIHPDDQGGVWSDVQAGVESGDPFETSYRIQTIDGETKWVWERGEAVTDDDGEVVALEGFITDVTDTKRRERHFEAIFDNTYQFTGLLRPDGTIVEANEPALSFAGVDREAVVGTPLWEAPWFQSNERARDVAREAVETAREGSLYREEIVVSGDGEEAFVDFSVRPVTDDEGEVTLLVPEGHDISELKAREQSLRERDQQFDAIFEDPNLLVGILDVDGRVEDVNETALEYVGASRDDVVGVPFWETPWWTEANHSAVSGWIEAAAEGEYVEYGAAHPDGDATDAFVEGSFRPVTDADGDVTGIVVSAKDVTERRRRERELERRNEQFDEFASFVSHDLQGPVSTVRGRLELARQTGEMEHVERAAEAVERVDELRTDLATTLRTGEIVSEIEPVNLEPVMEDVWVAVDPPERASVRVEDDARIEADDDAIQRLLENLVGNSIEHGPDDVAIRLGELDAGFYYEDSGPGIDPDHRDRVFAPGFSTKNEEGGIGMGLAIVRQIVLAHGWEIRIGDGDRLDGVRFEITGV